MNDNGINWSLPEPEDDEQRGRFTGLLIGLGMGLVTLVLIVALVGTMVGYVFWSNNAEQPSSPTRPVVSQPSEADLRPGRGDADAG